MERLFEMTDIFGKALNHQLDSSILPEVVLFLDAGWFLSFI